MSLTFAVVSLFRFSFSNSLSYLHSGYPPAIAKFLGHGRKIKLYTMDEIDKLVTERKAKYEHFGLIQRKEGKAPCAYFARRSDLAEHKIPEVQPRRIA